MIITTNHQVTQWGPSSAMSLSPRPCDRMRHHSYTLFIQGESYGLRQKKKVACGCRRRRPAVRNPLIVH
jgi:DNA replication protein DnaC